MGLVLFIPWALHLHEAFLRLGIIWTKFPTYDVKLCCLKHLKRLQSPIKIFFRLVVHCYNEFQSCRSGLSQYFFCFRALENWIHKPLSWRGNWRSKETSCWHRSSRAFCPQTQSFKYFWNTRCWLKLKKKKWDPLYILIIPVLYMIVWCMNFCFVVPIHFLIVLDWCINTH